MADGLDDLGLALALVDLGGAHAMRRFRAADLAVETKADGSLVTDADRAVERAWRERLAEVRPQHAILGEEEGPSGESASRWLLDPIDRTNHFVAGRPEWYVQLALVRGREVVVGVVSAPALGRRWWAARGHGAFLDGRRLRVSTTSVLRRATVHDDWSAALARGEAGHPVASLAAVCGCVASGAGDAFLDVAEGRSDVGLSVGGEPWDFAPARVIVEEAGGRFSDLDGRDTLDSRHALASNGHLHAAALAALAPGRGRPHP